MKNRFYSEAVERKNEKRKSLAVLIDPDKTNAEACSKLLDNLGGYLPQAWFVGGSLLMNNYLEELIVVLQKTNIPIVLFPSNYHQISTKADAILFLSLISGRNPDFLIGQQVLAAPFLKKTNLEIIPTGYMLIEGGKTTTAHYISNSLPIPYDKDDIAVCTAMAGEMLGLKLIYMDAGSGASQTINPSMIRAVRSQIDIPLIVGGGIRTAKDLHKAYEAGADWVVVGSLAEQEPHLIKTLQV